VGTVLASDLSLGKRRQEPAWSVEVRHLQVGRSDALRIVGIRASPAGQPEPGGELCGLLIE
jgi:hypothetical protein